MTVEITVRGADAMILGLAEVEAVVRDGCLYSPSDCVTVRILSSGTISGATLRFLDQDFALDASSLPRYGRAVKPTDTINLCFEDYMLKVWPA